MAVKRFLLALMPCTCKIAAGPAGDYRHHDRQCWKSRLAGRWRMAHEDPQTGWVTYGR